MVVTCKPFIADDYKSIPSGPTDALFEEVIPRFFKSFPLRSIHSLSNFLHCTKFSYAGPFTKKHILERTITPRVCLGGFFHCSDC